MENNTSLYEYLINLDKNIKFKRDSHYLSSKYFGKINKRLGILSVSLAVVILGFATYFVDREDISPYIQWFFVIVTITQGIILVVQIYIRADSESAKHYEIGSKLGVLSRRVGYILAMIKDNPDDDYCDDIQDIISEHNTISREAIVLPERIIRKQEKTDARRQKKALLSEQGIPKP